jgi:hypothetical protein
MFHVVDGKTFKKINSTHLNTFLGITLCHGAIEAGPTVVRRHVQRALCQRVHRPVPAPPPPPMTTMALRRRPTCPVTPSPRQRAQQLRDPLVEPRGHDKRHEARVRGVDPF